MNARNLVNHQSATPGSPPRLFAVFSTAKSRACAPYALTSFFQETTLRPAGSFVLIDNDDASLPAEIALFQQFLTLISHDQARSFAANANLMIEREDH